MTDTRLMRYERRQPLTKLEIHWALDDSPAQVRQRAVRDIDRAHNRQLAVGRQLATAFGAWESRARD